MIEYDPGPPPSFAELFARLPDYKPYKALFWSDWGPIFYRGRLDGSARVLCVASDPGPTERVALRTLVGDAGQRVQAFLTRLGLTRSYICFNAFAYALHPTHADETGAVLKDAAHVAWRAELFDAVKTPHLQAVIAFGEQAQTAVKLWPGKGNLVVCEVPHPSSRDSRRLAAGWHAAVEQLRGVVTPDADGDPTIANFGATMTDAHYTPIPRRDLPFGVPDWLGDDRWGRRARPRHNDCVDRPSPDDGHTLIWKAPRS